MREKTPEERAEEAVKKNDKLEVDIMEKVIDYLDYKRDEGEMNMFGAGVDLVEKFCFTRAMSHEYLEAWMRG